MGVAETKMPGITRSRFSPTESRGFLNKTVIAHMVPAHGSIVKNNPTHHFSK